ncbi:MAG TPA: UDP-N-acetylmuramate--L-alanine ligase [Acidimicrobiia bacterium]|jgi:UDP-N-acetylmuramate--alanine ligase
MRIEYRRVHLIGAGGAGMSAIAKVLAGMGHVVSGSDLRGGSTLDRLADFGITIYTGHHPEAARGADLVVASSAVPNHDPELVAATEAGVPVWRRPELLAALTAGIPTVGATGTHGKTTTTALLISALQAAGEDPSFIVGGDLADWNTNGHYGSTDLLVVEADEAFRTFESLHLVGLVITNIEAEHLEHFGTEDDLAASFVKVARSVAGPVVACADDPGALAVAREVGAITYGIDAGSDWRIDDLVASNGGIEFDLVGPDGTTRVSLNRPGAHVARNAAGVLALTSAMGRDIEASVRGLASFRGVGRRWEHRGTVSGVTLIDDYAHHPTEVAATLAAGSGIVPGRVWAVFQPHLYSRTARFQQEFGAALSQADEVVVTDVYGSREEPVPGVTGRLIADAARSHGASVHYVPHMVDLAQFLAERVEEGDLVLTMGAGDITLVPTELALRLAESK